MKKNIKILNNDYKKLLADLNPIKLKTVLGAFTPSGQEKWL